MSVNNDNISGDSRAVNTKQSVFREDQDSNLVQCGLCDSPEGGLSPGLPCWGLITKGEPSTELARLEMLRLEMTCKIFLG